MIAAEEEETTLMHTHDYGGRLRDRSPRQRETLEAVLQAFDGQSAPAGAVDAAEALAPAAKGEG